MSKSIPFDTPTLVALGLLQCLLYFFGDPFSTSLLIGHPSPYRGFLILLVFESCRSIFNLIIWCVRLLHSYQSEWKLYKYSIPFTAVLLLSVIGVPLLGLPFEFFCLLVMQKYLFSKNNLPQLLLSIVSLPFMFVNLLVWTKHAGWQNSYSLWNHFLGILYAYVFYPNDFPRKHVSMIWGEKWQQLILNMFGWVSLFIGWQYPYACFELVHLQHLLALSIQFRRWLMLYGNGS